MKIAIIGSGISGLTAAYILSRRHEVTVFEKRKRIGGHTATRNIVYEGQEYAVDTGFIVYNDWTYPNFNKLLNQLDIEGKKSEMSFSLSCQTSGLEYSGSSINTLFAQRKNLFSLYFWKLLRDIVRFNKESMLDLKAGAIPAEMTLGNYLSNRHYSDGFIYHYLVPMGAAIWSASTKMILDFPLDFFVRFFNNHGLLSVNNRPQWYVIPGGSCQYLEPLTRPFADSIHCDSHISGIRRTSNEVIITMKDGQQHQFDHIVIATHSDQALALLDDATDDELDVLGAIPYQDNEVVLHYDESLLPENKKTWSSWNYKLTELDQSAAVLTYNMNILQGIQAPVQFCVTLNQSDAISPDKILGKYNFAHPVFSLNGQEAQRKRDLINGHKRTWFCGAYWGNGFHEDGVNSAIAVTSKLDGSLL